jgi:hypothetical protein
MTPSHQHAKEKRNNVTPAGERLEGHRHPSRLRKKRDSVTQAGQRIEGHRQTSRLRIRGTPAG